MIPDRLVLNQIQIQSRYLKKVRTPLMMRALGKLVLCFPYWLQLTSLPSFDLFVPFSIEQTKKKIIPQIFYSS